MRIHRDVQMMFQDSYAAMDPRMRIDQILAEPMSIQKTGNARQIAERIMEILEQVGLTEESWTATRTSSRAVSSNASASPVR